MKEIIKQFEHEFMRIMTILIMVFMMIPVVAQNKRALVVGISEYQKTDNIAWSTIHGANDANLISSMLKKQGFKTTKLCNKSATALQIRKELNKLTASCKPGDIVYLHFSCHGQPFEDTDGDEEDGWDESIIPYDALMVYNKGKYEGANHIVDDELYTYFRKIRNAIGNKGFLCVVVDACHAGGASRGEEGEDDEDEIFVRGTKRGFSPNGKEFRPRINASGNFQIPIEKGLSNIMVLEACRSYQSNYEIKQSGKYFGPLSYYINVALTKHKMQDWTKWVQEVKKLMNTDNRLTRQNMVYETSLKQ